MRTLATCVLLWISASSAYAFDSAWQRLESYRLLAGSCSPEIQKSLKGFQVADLDEPIAVIYEREANFVSSISKPGNIVQARRAMDDYRIEMVRQLDEAVKTLGCEKAIQRLGLDIPKPITKQQMIEFVRSVPIPTSERTDSIPAIDRIRTKAAYTLQKIITRALIDKKQCDLATLKVSVVKETPREAINPPPFVGVPKSHEERWDIVCDGSNLTASVTFVQDARRWRNYKIETKNSASENADAVTSGGLRKGLD